MTIVEITGGMDRLAASASRRVVLIVDAIDLGEMQCRSGIVASGESPNRASRLFNIRTKFGRTFGQPAGECGWSGEPRLSRTEGRGSGPMKATITSPA